MARIEKHRPNTSVQKSKKIEVASFELIENKELEKVVRMMYEGEAAEFLMLSKQHVHTPFELCWEILENLQINPTKKFLVITAVEFVVVLIDVFKVAKQNIFFLDEGQKDGTIDSIKAVVLEELGLEQQQILTMDGVSKMKFDYVVGNPPFNVDKEGIGGTRGKQLFAQFATIAMDCGNMVGMVLPALWTHKPNKFKTAMIEYGMMQCFDSTQNFKISLPTCVVILKKNYIGPCTINGRKTQNLISDPEIHLGADDELTQILALIKSDINMAQMWTRSPLYNNDPDVGTGEIPFITMIDTKTSQPIYSTIPNLDNVVDSDKWRVICNLNLGRNELGVLMVVPPGVATSYSVIQFVCSSEEQANLVLMYLQSDLVKFIISKLKNTVSKNKNLFTKLPVPKSINFMEEFGITAVSKPEIKKV